MSAFQKLAGAALGSMVAAGALGVGLACPPLGAAMVIAGAIGANDKHNYPKSKTVEAPEPTPEPPRATSADYKKAMNIAKAEEQLLRLRGY